MSNPEDTDLTVEEEDPWAEAMDEQSAEEEPAEEEPVEEEAAEEEDPWAEAMEEQSAEEESTEEEAAEEEPVADVIPEQANESATDKTTANVAEEKSPVVPTPKPTPQPTQAPNAKPAGDEVFKPLNTDVSQTAPRELEMIMDIPVKLYVELGRTRITIKQLLELTQGSVVELEGLAGDPMDILINGHLIAQGEIVVVDEKYGIRVTEIITPSERAQKLNQ